MNFIKLLEENKKLDAIKEMKSKMDGFKSGKLIDKEEEITEKYSGKKKEEENINEETKIEVPDPKKIVDKYDDAEKGMAELEKANFEYKKKVYVYVSQLLKDIQKNDAEKVIKAAAKKHGKKKGKERLDVYDTYSTVYKTFNEIGTVKKQSVVDIQQLYDYAKDLEDFIK